MNRRPRLPAPSPAVERGMRQIHRARAMAEAEALIAEVFGKEVGEPEPLPDRPEPPRIEPDWTAQPAKPRHFLIGAVIGLVVIGVAHMLWG